MLPSVHLRNRELSWLQFNGRVLEMAADCSIPLLDRVRFASIFSGNLDEFFQVRVSALLNLIDAEVGPVFPGGMTPVDQLSEVLHDAEELCVRQERLFVDELRPALARAGITIAHWSECSDREQAEGTELFERLVHPVLTPLAVDPSHPFPYVSNLSLSLAVVLDADGERRFARVKVPTTIPRFVSIGREGKLLAREALLAAHLDRVFPDVDIQSLATFRVTRSTDFGGGEHDADDLLVAVEMELRRQRLGRAVRLEASEGLSPDATELLLGELELSPVQMVRRRGPLDLSALSLIADLDRPDLKGHQRRPRHVTWGESERSGGLFDTLKVGPKLVHHPYQSFGSTVEEFLRAAAQDPDVVAIKMTLYRTSAHGAIIGYLTEAVERGAEVVALVELRARFDELANVQWARRLEQVGAHVTYGIVGLKTHAKCILVVRREGDHLRRYVHVGTGNYNSSTARIYEDFSLFSADPELAADVGAFFNYLTGYSKSPGCKHLVLSPTGIRQHLIDQVDQEITFGAAGHIVWKVNALVDRGLIEALYRASAAGVRVDVIVRGACCLLAQVPGLSENIFVRSVLGRFLEHSRVYFAAHGSGSGRSRYLIGSADAMPRNLDDRVEALVPLEHADHRRRVQLALDALLTDDRHAWTLDADGKWNPVGRPDGTSAQDRLEMV
jgi:polyphosphate kinase